MTITEYIHSLIEDGTWSKLSTESQSIFLLIHAKYKGEPIKLSYRVIQEATGVSKSIVKAKLAELVEHGLIEIGPDSKKITPTVELSNEGLPVPPDDPEQDSGEYVDLLEWVREWVATPWGQALGGIVLFYLIKLWMEYIESQVFETQGNFIAIQVTTSFGLQGLEERCSSDLKFPLGLNSLSISTLQNYLKT